MKIPMLVAVKLKGKRGRKESFVKVGGVTCASFETWHPKQEAKPLFARCDCSVCRSMRDYHE